MHGTRRNTPSAPPSEQEPVRPGSWLRGPRGVALVLAFAAAIAVPIVALHSAHQSVNLASYLAMVLVGLCYGLAYQGTFNWLIPRLAPEAGGVFWRRLPSSIVGLAIAILAGGSLTEALLPLFSWSADQHWWVGGAIITLVRMVHLDYERLERRVHETQLREEKARHQASRAELDALVARADPHFLFNSLNTVAGLIEEDPSRAVEVVTRLAALYQHTLSAGRSEAVPLEGELTAAAAYLEIQALRFEGRLHYQVRSDPEAARAIVPPLCLQPLVENAVLHGGSEASSLCRVTVDAEMVGDAVCLRVEDDGPGPGRSKHHGNGTALADLEERLALVTDGRARLELAARSPRGFRAEVHLPLSGA